MASRWLSSVNSLLEKLDGQVETAIEEQLAGDQEEGDHEDSLDAILAQRGLAAATNEEEQSSPKGDLSTPATGEDVPDGWDLKMDNDLDFDDVEEESGLSTPVESKTEVTPPPPPTATEEVKDNVTADVQPTEPDKEDETAEEKVENDSNQQPDKDSSPPPTEETQQSTKEPTPQATQQLPPPPPPPPPPKQQFKLPPPPPPATPVQGKPAGQDSTLGKQQLDASNAQVATLSKQLNEVKKEARTLRRHVVSLNAQLEKAESEIQAQRDELEGVGGRMEKERAKMKEQRDKERAANVEEIKKLKSNHEEILLDQKTRLEKQLEQARSAVKNLEEKRMQEGGNRNKELAEAMERERLATEKNMQLEDEKATFLSQISTLQAQQMALGDRIESLTETADSAMEREREADERLDEALSVHAKQLSQRQTREAELERTITELGTALALARRNKEGINRMQVQQDGSTGESTSQDALNIRLESVQHDLDTCRGQLDLEQQRSETLQKELRDVTKERMEDSAKTRAQQIKYDRQLADLSLELSRMRESKREEGSSIRRETDEDEREVRNQIKTLSEEVLKQREKMGNSSSEIAALKIRLKTALERAAKAEEDLEALQNADSGFEDIELVAPRNATSRIRRRGVGSQKSQAPTIRSAMHLDGEGGERVGKAIDAVDSFSVSTGKYLRANPFARAGFLLYLLLLHLWSFVILFFHAHNFEQIHGDFGENVHGPHALMQRPNLQVAPPENNP